MDRRSFFRAAACMAATPIALLAAKAASTDEATVAVPPVRLINVFGAYTPISAASAEQIERVKRSLQRAVRTA